MAKKKKRDEMVFLEDILECIEKIEDYIRNLTEKEFEDITEFVNEPRLLAIVLTRTFLQEANRQNQLLKS